MKLNEVLALIKPDTLVYINTTSGHPAEKKWDVEIWIGTVENMHQKDVDKYGNYPVWSMEAADSICGPGFFIHLGKPFRNQ